MVIMVGLSIDQIAQSGLSSLKVIYYSAQLFRTCILWHLTMMLKISAIRRRFLALRLWVQ
ncbi:hypothetical protein DO233_22340 [Salmonella enterica]|nr:hypothetical protein [Salmonella enterica]EBJ1200660.1 hypothetical protein [Salmonella enterica]EBN9019701.1 hypothetical protein [Salmonella enterica]